VLYFGYDVGDRVFDNAKARESMDKMISGVVGDLPVEWRWFKCAVCFHSFWLQHDAKQHSANASSSPCRYSGMEGKVFWIYEDLFRQA
jgi:hypothetical protein